MAKLINCRTCGKPIAKGAKVCPHCGAKNKKKTPVGIYVVCVLLVVWMMGVASQNSTSKPQGEEGNTATNSYNTEETPSPDELLSFDERTWNDFKDIYTAHNSLMDAMRKYADGTMSAVSFYDYCEKAEQYFSNASLSFSYGENNYQKTYLAAFQSMALSDQMAAKALIKYLDSFKTSDLSEAQENINQATAAATTIASNRGKLLVLAGLSDEEIRTKVEADTADLG